MSGNRNELRYTNSRGDREWQPRDDVRVNEKVCDMRTARPAVPRLQTRHEVFGKLGIMFWRSAHRFTIRER